MNYTKQNAVILMQLLDGTQTVYHKTYRDDFFEKFPKAFKNIYDNPQWRWCDAYNYGKCYAPKEKLMCHNCPMWKKEIK